MYHTTKRDRTIGSVLVLIGAALLLIALFTTWYDHSESGSFGGVTIKDTSDFYLGNGGSAVQSSSSCSGNASICQYVTGNTTSMSYTQARLNDTGSLAVAGQGVVIAGFVLGLLSALLGIGARSNQPWVLPTIVLAILALILAIAAPLLMFAAQPAAIDKDVTAQDHGVPPTGSGPWSSFAGSNASFSWGPSMGWYISLGASAVILVGGIFWLRARGPPPTAGPDVTSSSTESPP